jgi:hypothetical protein
MFKSSIIILICFLIAANPAVYRATRSVLGGWIATPEGTAKLGGLILHAVVFMMLVSLAKRAVSPYGHTSYMEAADDMDAIDGMSTKSQEMPYTM